MVILSNKKIYYCGAGNALKNTRRFLRLRVFLKKKLCYMVLEVLLLDYSFLIQSFSMKQLLSRLRYPDSFNSRWTERPLLTLVEALARVSRRSKLMVESYSIFRPFYAALRLVGPLNFNFFLYPNSRLPVDYKKRRRIKKKIKRKVFSVLLGLF